MPNFLLIKRNNCQKEIITFREVSHYKYSYSYKDYAVFLDNFSKFSKDCVFKSHSNNDHTMIAGVLINKRNYCSNRNATSLEEAILTDYKNNGERFFQEFEGSFFGAKYDYYKDKVILFSDALGNYPIYYYIDDDWFIASNLIKNVVQEMKALKIVVGLNERGVYSLLTYAYYYGDETMVKGIKRLIPGKYISLDSVKIEIKEFFTIQNEITKETENKIIQTIDKLFLEAIRLQSKKNIEYDFVNYAALSGGLDSRMCVYALNRIGADNIVCYTYSETGQLDQLIPQHIIHDLGFKWLFKSLDFGDDLKNIDEAIDISDMRCYYPWAAQLNEFLKYSSTSLMGLVFTGVIGDVVVGTYCHNYKQIGEKYKLGDGAYSQVLIDRLKEYCLDEIDDVSYERGMLYNRAFNGACLGYSTAFQRYTEALSPFMYRPLFDYCMRIPAEYRYQHNIYFKWIKQYYPEMLKYSCNGMKIPQHNCYIRLKGKKIYIETIPSRVREIISAKTKKNYGMNPFDYWYEHNPKLRNAMDTYYLANLCILNSYPNIKRDVEKLYSGYSVKEKTMCISVLGFCKELFDDVGVLSPIPFDF